MKKLTLREAVVKTSLVIIGVWMIFQYAQSGMTYGELKKYALPLFIALMVVYFYYDRCFVVERELIEDLIKSDDERSVQLMLHRLAREAQSAFDAKAEVTMLDENDFNGWTTSRKKQIRSGHARKAKVAEKAFRDAHRYFTEDLDMVFPFAAISDFAKNDPVKKSWVTSQQYKKDTEKAEAHTANVPVT